MKTFLTLFVLFFSSSVFAAELKYSCPTIPNTKQVLDLGKDVVGFKFFGEVYVKYSQYNNDHVLGCYKRLPIENAWHTGSIYFDKKQLKWKNASGASWKLKADIKNNKFITGNDNPYADYNDPHFYLLFKDDILFEVMDSTGYTNMGLHGYMHADANGKGLKYGYGISFYTNIWASFDDYLIDNFQIGHGTWITPDNFGNTPLCPKGTTARDNWPERAPSYRDVFQTIEGGPGYWVNTKFPSKQMKYRVNGTTDCYTSQIASPGWTWDGAPLSSNVPGLAQLSNKLLYPPDGITFDLDIKPKFLGQAWMALPLTNKKISNTGHITGPNNWTLFLKAKNFNGPVVYWVPEAWSNISKNYSPANGRTLDSQPKLSEFAQPMANEINTVYMFQTKQDGKIYSRIPKLKFPIDEENRTIFHQDVKMYSKAAIYNQVEQAINSGKKFPDGKFNEKGTHNAKLKARNSNFKHNNKIIKNSLKIFKLSSFNSPSKKNYAWGIEWQNNYKNGYFPEYFIDQTISFEDNIPIKVKTNLQKKTFPKKKSGNQYKGYRKLIKNKDHKIFQASLNDGSVVLYKWFKFIDQPAIKKLNLESGALDRLQKTIEKIHTLWTTEKEFMSAPTNGKLISIENSLVVTPPLGMEIGYVPIALAQKKK